MYDPARDSWKSDEDELLEQSLEEAAKANDDSSPAPVPEEDEKRENERDEKEEAISEPKDETKDETLKGPSESSETTKVPEVTEKPTEDKQQDAQENNNTKSEVPESKEVEPLKDEEEKTENDSTSEKRKLSASPTPVQGGNPDDNSIALNESEKASTEAAAEPELPTKPDAPQQEDEEPKEPPRKIRKPNSRMSEQDRLRKVKEDRERIERNEKRENGEDGGSQNRNNASSIVRQHYNERPDQGVQRRQASPIIKLRSFNNWIKYVLISKFSRRGYTVLDIGCGKGGDLLKWDRAGCKGFIGIDIAEVSIAQARQRYAQVRNKRFWADFCVGDAFGERVENIVHPEAFPVDIVSSQFCLHYAFENEDRVRMLLANIARSLRRGGVFIGTIPNSDVINKQIRKLEAHELKWGNSIYSVEFDVAPPRDGVFKPPFGHKYKFFLEDAVGNVPEYVVPFEAFRAMAAEYDLDLLYKKPFLKLFDEEFHHNSYTLRTAENMGVIKRDGSLGIEGDEREACGFYLAFAFEKIMD